MIYITDSNSRSNILSITAGCREYRLFVVHNSQESVTMLSRAPSQLGSVEFGHLILRKITKKVLPSDVRFKG